MFKRFLFMLAVAFVLQITAGVASAYCMHETGQASEHFGHHQHVHKDADGDDGGSTPAKKASSDPDCASCSHGSLVMFSLSSEIAPLPLTAHENLARLPSQPTPYLGLPERPNWIRAA